MQERITHLKTENSKVGHDLKDQEPPASAEPHPALPVRGTFRRADSEELLHTPAARRDYPVAAECICGSTIGKQDSLGSWQHAK